MDLRDLDAKSKPKFSDVGGSKYICILDTLVYIRSGKMILYHMIYF